MRFEHHFYYYVCCNTNLRQDIPILFPQHADNVNPTKISTWNRAARYYIACLEWYPVRSCHIKIMEWNSAMICHIESLEWYPAMSCHIEGLEWYVSFSRIYIHHQNDGYWWKRNQTQWLDYSCHIECLEWYTINRLAYVTFRMVSSNELSY